MSLFGTDGIRTKVGHWPLNRDCLTDIGKSIGTWLIDQNSSPKIIIAHDTRQSCSLIKALIKCGLLQYNIDIFDAETLPTPVVFNLTKKQKLFDCGIVITASHNLYQDNGIKIISNKSGKLNKADEEKISEIFIKKNFNQINYDNLGRSHYFAKAKGIYFQSIIKFFKNDFLKNKTIAIDCANGAASAIVFEIFNFFGAETIIIENHPNGFNINKECGSTNPKLLQDLMSKGIADIGFAFDGDGDRIIVVNKNGQIKDGDDILALLLNHPIYESKCIVSSIISNYGLELYLKEKNKEIIRVPVGDKNIINKLTETNLLLGGEPSGHIVLRDYLNTSDAIFASLRILEAIQFTGNWEFQTFEKYPQYSINLKIHSKKDLKANPLHSIIDHYQNITPGRLLIRYSGTEPLLRIIVETQSLDKSKQIADNLYKDLKPIFEVQDSNERENHIPYNI